MKKTYVLLTVLLIALMTAGLSYAYWTDTLTVNGIAETGNIDVKLLPGSDYEFGDYNGVAQGDTYVKDDKTLAVEVNNLYPGSYFESYA